MALRMSDAAFSASILPSMCLPTSASSLNRWRDPPRGLYKSTRVATLRPPSVAAATHFPDIDAVRARTHGSASRGLYSIRAPMSCELRFQGGQPYGWEARFFEHGQFCAIRGGFPLRACPARLLVGRILDDAHEREFDVPAALYWSGARRPRGVADLRDHDWISPRHRHRNRIPPSVTRRVDVKRIPHHIGARLHRLGCSTLEQCWQVSQVARTGDALLIPEVEYTRIGQQSGGPLRSCIAGIHVEPDRVDAEGRGRIVLEEITLRPPGGCQARRSGRRQ